MKKYSKMNDTQEEESICTLEPITGYTYQGIWDYDKDHNRKAFLPEIDVTTEMEDPYYQEYIASKQIQDRQEKLQRLRALLAVFPGEYLFQFEYCKTWIREYGTLKHTSYLRDKLGELCKGSRRMFAIYELGLIEKQVGNIERAIAWFEMIEYLDHSGKELALLELGIIYFQYVGDLETARYYFTQVENLGVKRATKYLQKIDILEGKMDGYLSSDPYDSKNYLLTHSITIRKMDPIQSDLYFEMWLSLKKEKAESFFKEVLHVKRKTKL